MPRMCSICSRQDASAVNELLRSGRSARSVAIALGLSEDALGRHAKAHVAAAPAASVPAPDAPREPLDPLDELTTALRVRALAGNPADTREYRLALAAQAAARHAAAPIRDLATEPEWISVRSRLLDALAPFHEARTAVADALEEASA